MLLTEKNVSFYHYKLTISLLLGSDQVNIKFSCVFIGVVINCHKKQVTCLVLQEKLGLLFGMQLQFFETDSGVPADH